jgi:hypothetical protein
MNHPDFMLWPAAVLLLSAAAPAGRLSEAQQLRRAIAGQSENVRRMDGECTDCAPRVLVIPSAQISPLPDDFCMTNPLIERAEGLGRREHWRGVFVDTLVGSGDAAVPAKILLTVVTADEAALVHVGRLCMPQEIALRGKRFALSGLQATADRPDQTQRGLRSFLINLFGAPIERYRQVYIGSAPTGLDLMLDDRLLSLRTDIALAVSDSQLARLWVRNGRRRMPLRACEQRPPVQGKAALAYFCPML